MSYDERINQIPNLSVFDVIRISRDILSEQYRLRPWELVHHGVNLLNTEDQLCAYISAYGEMHWTKCRAAFQNFPFRDLVNHFEIVDWGCGQGIASLSLIEMLRERDKLDLLHKVTLIDPSEIALNRADVNIRRATNGAIQIITQPKYLPNSGNETEIQGITYNKYIVIHLFSNILDIPTINLERLAQIVGCHGHKHYIMCVGPKNSGVYRIDQFCSIFTPSEYISNIDSAQFAYTSDTHKSFSCRTKCFLYEGGELSIPENITPITIDDTPIYDDYDPRILHLNNVTNKHTNLLLDVLNDLRFLRNTDFIYIRPDLCRNRPDIVIVRPRTGILLINICEETTKDGIDKAIKKINAYHEDIINTEKLKAKVYSDEINRGLVKKMLYIPSISAEDTSILRKDSDCKYISIIGRDINNTDICRQVLKNTKMHYINPGFDDIVLNSIIDLVAPKWHSYRQGDNIPLTKQQEELVRSSANARQKINGVAGSGKTQVLAIRAVNAHLRTGRKVLVLTFNITLVNHIKHRVGKVRADFSWDNIVINNYHQFFNTIANNNYITYTKGSYNRLDFFDNVLENLEKYSAIFIDEVQDFETNWLRILHDRFLEKNGEFVVFGDAKQNVYNRQLGEDGNVRLDIIRGRWNNSLNRGMRFLNQQLTTLAINFQRTFFTSQEVDDIGINQELQFGNNCIQYLNINDPLANYQDIVKKCIEIIKDNELEYKDTVILSIDNEPIRELEYILRCRYNIRTSCTSERKEAFEQLQRRYAVNTRSFEIERDRIRGVKRRDFSIGSNNLKLSTIKSFKGLEQNNVIVVLPQNMNNHSELYVGITRARERLFIINMGNNTYHNFFEQYSHDTSVK